MVKYFWKYQLSSSKFDEILEDAINLILQGYHVVQNIATGGGKSFAQIAINLFAEGVIITIITFNDCDDATQIQTM